MTKKRFKNLCLSIVTNPFNMIVLVSLIILFCLIIIPLLSMVKSTFTLAQSELRRVDGAVGDFTLYYWKYMLVSNMSKAVLWGPLKNSFVSSSRVKEIAMLGGSIDNYVPKPVADAVHTKLAAGRHG